MTDLVLIIVIQDLKSHDQYEVPDSFSESDKCKDKLLKQNLDKLRGRNLNILKDLAKVNVQSNIKAGKIRNGNGTIRFGIGKSHFSPDHVKGTR